VTRATQVVKLQIRAAAWRFWEYICERFGSRCGEPLEARRGGPAGGGWWLLSIKLLFDWLPNWPGSWEASPLEPGRIYLSAVKE